MELDFTKVNDRVFCIYLCENIITGKKYIGRTSNFKRRQRNHFNPEKTRNNYFDNCLKKYDKENFEWIILEEGLTYNESIKKEIYYIKKYITKYPNGMNLTEGGEGCLKHEVSDEARRKISIAHKGNISLLKGKKLSIEHRKKLSESHKGKSKKVSVETRKKMSIAKKGKKTSKETKRKMSIANKGKILSDETKRKMSMARMGKKRGKYKREQ